MLALVISQLLQMEDFCHVLLMRIKCRSREGPPGSLQSLQSFDSVVTPHHSTAVSLQGCCFQGLFWRLLTKPEEGCSGLQEWGKQGWGALGTSLLSLVLSLVNVQEEGRKEGGFCGQFSFNEGGKGRVEEGG